MGRHKRHRKALKLLVNLFRPFYNYDRTDVKKLRSTTRDILKTFRRQLGETIKANSPKSNKNLTEQSKLNRKKLMRNGVTNRS